MSTLPPPEEPSGDDPFRKPPNPAGGGGPYGNTPPPEGGNPYGGPYGDDAPPPPPYGGGGVPPYDPSGYGGADPLAGMPPLADPGRRLLARLIDIVIVTAVLWLIFLVFGGYRLDTENVDYGRSGLQSLVAAVVYIGYDTLLMSRTGQTLGKRVMGLRAAMLDNGATPTVQAVLTRSAVLWIPAVFCCACFWTAICGGWSLFDKPYRQGLHDKAGKTVVVRA